MFTSGPVALEETWKIAMKTEMAGIVRTSWRTSGLSRVAVNVVHLQDLRGGTRGKRHFRSGFLLYGGAINRTDKSGGESQHSGSRIRGCDHSRRKEGTKGGICVVQGVV